MAVDFIGSLISLLSTYYFMRLHQKAWLIGIIATCINGWLYWEKGIYADMTLELIYFMSMGYGWYQWQKPLVNKTELQHQSIYHLQKNQWYWLSLLLILIFLIIYSCLNIFTHSQVALLDALTTTLSLIAQLLMCYKVITTWVLWFVTDTLYAWLYFNKNLPFHCILMLFYSVLAIIGYIAWSRRANTLIA